ncbi:MAG TPA: CHAD domain-containing protein [Pyrinomonadaceae bacterium]|nr:CHAD domain-containing protein [Pyrinomonadaceae bacterium]
MKCNGPATTGIKQVLVTRFEELHGWHDAALDWSDPEGVHSMRVASRRLRSTLRDFLPYVRKRNLAPALKRFKDVADTLGRVRDLDVAILALEEIEKQAPPKLASGIKQFVDKKKEVRERARKDLKAMLKKSELKQLASEFHAGVDKATASSESTLTFADVSRTVILDRLREFERLTNGLFKPLDAEALHDLRIAVKRLRYAVELFQQCWTRGISASAKRAARIQSALGDLHDCDVWIVTLGKHIGDARKQKDEQYVAALVWLLTHFIKLRTKHLRRALLRWREWETHDTSGRLRAVLTEKPRGTRSRRKKEPAATQVPEVEIERVEEAVTMVAPDGNSPA